MMARLFFLLLSTLCSVAWRADAQASTALPNCTLQIPTQPLTAIGLAEPYVLQAPCSMTRPDTDAAFVHVTIVDLETGALSVYNPLVVDADFANYTQTLAVPTVVPNLPTHYTAAIWFGFNGNNLTLANKSPGTAGGIQNANCVNGGGLNRTCNFGQYAYCNAAIFFTTLNNMVAQNMIHVPPIGTAADGQPCPTVRDYSVVDQTPSDNVPATYLSITTATGATQTIQDTAANRAAYPGYQLIDSSSDNDLLDSYISPALGCASSIWKVRNLAETNVTSPVYTTTSVALNELQAALYQPFPMARVPFGDVMTFNDAPSIPFTQRGDVEKLNAYRVSVNQVTVMIGDDASTTAYCTNLFKYGVPRIYNNKGRLQAVVDQDNLNGNLYDYLIARLNSTIAPLPYGLGCVQTLLPSLASAPMSPVWGYASTNIGAQNLPVGWNPSATADQLRDWFEQHLLPAAQQVPAAPAGRFDNVREGVSYTVVTATQFNWSVQSFFIGFCVMLFIAACAALAVYLCLKHRYRAQHSATFSGLTPSQSPEPLLKPNMHTIELETSNNNNNSA